MSQNIKLHQKHILTTAVVLRPRPALSFWLTLPPVTFQILSNFKAVRSVIHFTKVEPSEE